MGITGSVRGINFDDFRPDLIVVDDCLTDENAATDEQREKFTNLLLGAVRESLTPSTENPNAKMVMLQTPLHKADASSQALKDDSWVSVVYSCWTRETADLPLELRRSTWEERYPTDTLITKAKAALRVGRYSIFAREYECRLVTSERASFTVETLKYWDDPEAPKLDHGDIVIAVDPVPPPSEVQLQKNLHNKDFEAIAVVMRKSGNYYLLAYETNRGHQPIWTAETVFKYIKLFTPIRIVVESVGYQRVLAGLIQNYLRRRQIYTQVMPFVDKRSKYNRIVGALLDVAAAGKLYVSHAHVDFIADYSTYPDVDHDDLLDAVSMGLSNLVNPYLEGVSQSFFGEQKDDFNRPLKVARRVP